MNLEALRQQIHQSRSFTKTTSTNDYWTPTLDISSVGSAIVRFLPTTTEDEFPFVTVHQHSFKVNGNWFIENCPTTITLGLPSTVCPVCAHVHELYQQGQTQTAKQRQRRTGHHANITVLVDNRSPGNVGNVFRYRFGTTIMDKIAEAVDAGIDPFDADEGANFRVRVYKNNNVLQYDKCSFEAPSPIINSAVIALARPLNKLVTAKDADELEGRYRSLLSQQPDEESEADTDARFIEEHLSQFKARQAQS